MKISQDIKRGYLWSFVAPLIVTLVFSVYMALISTNAESEQSFVERYISMVVIIGFFSFLISGFLCAVFGIPLVSFLKKKGKDNVILMTLAGGVIAFLFGFLGGAGVKFQIVYGLHGLLSGFFFWFGASRSEKNND